MVRPQCVVSVALKDSSTGMIRFVSHSALIFTLVVAGGSHIDALAATSNSNTDRSESFPWETVVDGLRAQTRKFHKDLKSAREALLMRAKKRKSQLD